MVIQGAMDKKHLIDDYRKAQLIDKWSVALQAAAFALSIWIIHATTR